MAQRGLAFYVTFLRVAALISLLAAASVGVGAMWVPTAQAMVLPFALFAVLMMLLAGLGYNVQLEIRAHGVDPKQK
jgi:hypothetical protein